MEPTLASREAVERVASFSLDDIMSFPERTAGTIPNGEYGQAFNLANAVREIYGLTTGAASKSSQETIETGTSDQKPTTTELTFKELEKRSRVLGVATTGFDGEDLKNPPQMPASVYLQLEQWLSASESRVLWIYGSPTTSKPSDLSSTSAFVVSTINHAKLPLIAHQCQSSESEMGALISLVYSVVIQLIWLLPEDFSTDIDLSPRRFSFLDRSTERLPHVLLLMEDLLTLASRLLVVIIDGIQLCENGLDELRGTGVYLNFFREILKNGEKDRVLKTLFTTDGVCENLWLKLVPQEQVDVRSKTGGTAERAEMRWDRWLGQETSCQQYFCRCQDSEK